MSIGVIRCGNCGTALELFGNEVFCVCGKTHYLFADGIYIRKDMVVDQKSEMLTRDKQAVGYLSHDKFPTQIASFDKWLKEIGATIKNGSREFPGNGQTKIALDLGCGPGPYTKKLQDLGFHVIAIDFSSQSLRLNAGICGLGRVETTFVQEDLNRLSLVENSVDLVVMADFIQHLGGRSQRERLLHEVFGSLKKNGCFYLSFFNLNIKNYLKSDVHGEFADGLIRYERLTAKNVISSFPNYISIDSVRPMNIVHGAYLDKALTALPLSRFFSRMAVVIGKKEGKPQPFLGSVACMI